MSFPSSFQEGLLSTEDDRSTIEAVAENLQAAHAGFLRHRFLQSHVARGIPPDTLLEGLQVRRSIPVPDELTDSAEERAAKALRRAAGERKWTPWKTIRGWRVSRSRLCDLGPVWTEFTEYRRA